MDRKKRRKEVFDNMLKQIEKLSAKKNVPKIQTFPFISSSNVVHFIEYCIVLFTVQGSKFENRKAALRWFFEVSSFFTKSNTDSFVKEMKSDELCKNTVSQALQFCYSLAEGVSRDYRLYADTLEEVKRFIKETRQMVDFLAFSNFVSKSSKSIQQVEASVSSIECIYNINHLE